MHLKVKLFSPKAPWDYWKTYFEDWRDSKKIIRIDRTRYKEIIKLFNDGNVVKIEKSKIFKLNERKTANAVQRYPHLPEGLIVKRRRK